MCFVMFYRIFTQTVTDTKTQSFNNKMGVSFEIFFPLLLGLDPKRFPQLTKRHIKLIETLFETLTLYLSESRKYIIYASDSHLGQF